MTAKIAYDGGTARVSASALAVRGEPLDAIAHGGRRFELRETNTEAIDLVALSASGETSWSRRLQTPQFGTYEHALRVRDGKVEAWADGEHAKGGHREVFEWAFTLDGEPAEPGPLAPDEPLTNDEIARVRGFLDRLAALKAEEDWPRREAPIACLRAVRRDGWHLAVDFDIDQLLFQFAQSGSDYYVQELFGGVARFGGTNFESASFRLVGTWGSIHERDIDTYDRAAGRERIRSNAAIGRER